MKEPLKEYVYDESNGIIYRLEGDYYLPELATTFIEKGLGLSVDGRSLLAYMKEHEPQLYVELAEQERLEEYIRDTLAERSERVSYIAEQMGGDANARSCAREIVNAQDYGEV